MIFSAARIANATLITVAISGIAIAAAETDNAIVLSLTGLFIVSALFTLASGDSAEEREIIERMQKLIGVLGGDIYY